MYESSLLQIGWKNYFSFHNYARLQITNLLLLLPLFVWSCIWGGRIECLIAVVVW